MQNDQTRIWDHFQGDAIHTFDLAIPRLSYLFASAKRFARNQRWHILNIGTGNGWMEQTCHKQGWTAYTLDPSKLAVHRIQEHGISGQVGLIEHAPFLTGTFDAVFCSEVFEHLTSHQLHRGLTEVGRMLRPGGYLIGSVPFNESLERGETVCPECGTVFHRWGHQQSFTTASMRSILTATGLQVVKIQVRAFPFFSEQSLLTMTKSSVAKLLGKLGVQAVFPTLCFFARKPGQ